MNQRIFKINISLKSLGKQCKYTEQSTQAEIVIYFWNWSFDMRTMGAGIFFSFATSENYFANVFCRYLFWLPLCVA